MFGIQQKDAALTQELHVNAAEFGERDLFMFQPRSPSPSGRGPHPPQILGKISAFARCRKIFWGAGKCRAGGIQIFRADKRGVIWIDPEAHSLWLWKYVDKYFSIQKLVESDAFE